MAIWHNSKNEHFHMIKNMRYMHPKPEDKLGCKADKNFDSGIVKTIKWYLGKYIN